jgi:sugar lactone lactonase YvrE
MHRAMLGFGALLAAVATALSLLVATGSAAKTATYLSSLHSIKTIASTVPPNGDLNPYGVVVVPRTIGALTAGDFLVSNFNARSNNQGTGSTIVQLSPAGKLSVFAQITASSLPGACPGGVGLTAALGVLPHGYVVVGSLPTTNGQPLTAKHGCLIVLNSAGHPVETIRGPDVEGPWGMATVTRGATTTLFVTDTIIGGADAGLWIVPTAMVSRIRLTTSRGVPRVTSQKIIITAIPWIDDKAALVIGPTGVALAANDTLYVADTLGNGIIAIPHAMTRTRAVPDRDITLTSGRELHEPLGLTIAPNGDIITTNAGNGDIVETTPSGKQVAAVAGDAQSGAGSLFGLAITRNHTLVYVDDGLNTLRMLR